jgi:hypothetical protein
MIPMKPAADDKMSLPVKNTKGKKKQKKNAAGMSGGMEEMMAKLKGMMGSGG